MKFKRIVLVVFDSLGVGALPDAEAYGDAGSNTLLHTARALNGIKLPNLTTMGISEILKLSDPTFASAPDKTSAFYSRMKEKSHGKDTTTGHWEMMGIILEKAFQTFPNGFPADLMNEWSKKTGVGFIGNKPASGTVIMDELGEQHLQTGAPIVYTSGDSVFQIAAHEEKFGLDRLHKLCDITRKFLNASPYKVGRVIARPFLGAPGSFKRTGNRKDYSHPMIAKTALDHLYEARVPVIGVGKIPYIYDFQGIMHPLEAHNDNESIDATLSALKTYDRGLIFTNLNDLDMIYGHRRDAAGYGKQLEYLDSQIPKIVAQLTNEDLLIFTADHGNDPTYKGTDHTREYVPLIAYSKKFGMKDSAKRRLTDRETFSDLGQTILENFDVTPTKDGTSFLKEMVA